MIKPYYEDEFCTIYNADCRAVLPQLEPVDLVLTDPPYGINAARDRKSQKHGWVDYPCNGWDLARPSKEAFDLILLMGQKVIIWGGNYFTDFLPPSSKWLIWDKGQTDFSLADAEIAWCSWSGAIRRKVLPRSRALQDGKQHATQKSLEVIKWCIGQAGQVETILDPFMGSGTTLRAAKDLGLKAVGIEIERKYCDIAIERLRQQAFQWQAS